MTTAIARTFFRAVARLVLLVLIGASASKNSEIQLNRDRWSSPELAISNARCVSTRACYRRRGGRQIASLGKAADPGHRHEFEDKHAFVCAPMTGSAKPG